MSVPGLQRERTQLAWGRSSLVLTTLLLSLIKLGAFSSLQLVLAVLMLRTLLGGIAARKNELSETNIAFNRGTVMRYLWVSLTVALAGIWVLLS